jgi:histidine triad (HIT) family protein
MAGNEKCLFCRIARNELKAKKVYEDADVVAFEDINPQAPTHVLIIPRNHMPSLDEVTDADGAILGTLVRRAAQIAKDLHLGEGWRLVANTGDSAGQTVFHILGGRNLGWPPG